MERTYLVVDAFATGPFSGNPAAVLLDARGLDDATMLAIAREFNLSETTFVLPPHDASLLGGDALAVRFRWFTPGLEVGMCGHASLAAIHALVETGRLALEEDADAVTLAIETRSGRLRGFVERSPGRKNERMYWLDLPDPVLRDCGVLHDDWLHALELPRDAMDDSVSPVRTQDEDIVAFVRDVATLVATTPNFARLRDVMKEAGVRGLSLATTNTLTPSIHVQSRFFAPAAGINEDPVTGSVHGPLAAILVRAGRIPVVDGLAAVTATQGLPGGRTGLLHALVRPKEKGGCGVRIGGRAVTMMRGTLYA